MTADTKPSYGDPMAAALISRSGSVDAEHMSKGGRIFIFVVFMVAISLTCGALINGNPVKDMWRRAEIPCGPAVCDHRGPNTVAAATAVPAKATAAPAEVAAAEAAPPEVAAGVAEVVQQKNVTGDQLAAGEATAATAQNATLGTQRLLDEIRVPQECPVATAYMQSWLTVYQSSEMIFAFLGLMLDYVGPKITFVTGEAILLGAIGLLGAQRNWMAMVLTGASTQLILNSCMSIGNLFSSYRNAVMGALSSGADISTLIWPLGYKLWSIWPLFDYRLFLISWGVCISLALLAGLIFLPNAPYPEPLEESVDLPERAPLLSGGSSSSGLGTQFLDRQSRSDIVSEVSGIPLWRASVCKQLSSLPLILFTIIWTQMAVRVNSFLIYNEDLFREYGDDGKMAQSLGWFFPMSVFPCLFVGYIADKVGVVYATMFLNTLAIVMNALTLIHCLWLQWVTIFCFIIFKSALFSMLFSYVAEVFGFSNFGTLTAIVSLVGGVTNYFAIAVSAKWAKALGDSWFWPNVVYLIMGVVGQVLLFLLIHVTPALPARHTEECQEHLHRKRLTTVVGKVGSCQSNVSMFLGEGEIGLTKLDKSFTDSPLYKSAAEKHIL